MKSLKTMSVSAPPNSHPHAHLNHRKAAKQTNYSWPTQPCAEQFSAYCPLSIPENKDLARPSGRVERLACESLLLAAVPVHQFQEIELSPRTLLNHVF